MHLQLVLATSHLVTFFCDNSRAVVNSKKFRSDKKAKHIERNYHLVRDIIKQGKVTMCKIE